MSATPNVFNHSDQFTALLALHEWQPIVTSSCSQYLELILCHVYLPPCPELEDHTSSGELSSTADDVLCRRLCEEARTNCTDVLKTVRFPWPKELSCDVFPVCDNYKTTSSSLKTDEEKVLETGSLLIYLAFRNFIRFILPSIRPSIYPL